MFPLPISFYIYLFLIITSVGGVWYGHHESVALDNYKQKVETLAKETEKHNQEVLAQQKAETERVTNDYKTKLNSISLYYDKLRQSSSGAMSSSSQTFTFPDGTTKNFVSVAQDCAATTQQLISLQEWVNAQIGIK